jgi:hypothetical protein
MVFLIQGSPMITDKPQLSAADDAGSAAPRPSRLQSAIRRRDLLLTTAMTLIFSTDSVLAGVEIRDDILLATSENRKCSSRATCLPLA